MLPKGAGADPNKPPVDGCGGATEGAGADPKKPPVVDGAALLPKGAGVDPNGDVEAWTGAR